MVFYENILADCVCFVNEKTENTNILCVYLYLYSCLYTYIGFYKDETFDILYKSLSQMIARKIVIFPKLLVHLLKQQKMHTEIKKHIYNLIEDIKNSI